MGQTRARFHSKESKEVLILMSKSNFKGRAITSFVPFKKSAVRLSGPQDFPVFNVSISFTISSISDEQNSERMDLSGQVGGVGRAPEGSATKTEAKYSEKASAISASFPSTSLVFYGIYAGAS